MWSWKTELDDEQPPPQLQEQHAQPANHMLISELQRRSRAAREGREPHRSALLAATAKKLELQPELLTDPRDLTALSLRSTEPKLRLSSGGAQLAARALASLNRGGRTRGCSAARRSAYTAKPLGGGGGSGAGPGAVSNEGFAGTLATGRGAVVAADWRSSEGGSEEDAGPTVGQQLAGRSAALLLGGSGRPQSPLHTPERQRALLNCSLDVARLERLTSMQQTLQQNSERRKLLSREYGSSKRGADVLTPNELEIKEAQQIIRAAEARVAAGDASATKCVWLSSKAPLSGRSTFHRMTLAAAKLELKQRERKHREGRGLWGAQKEKLALSQALSQKQRARELKLHALQGVDYGSHHAGRERALHKLRASSPIRELRPRAWGESEPASVAAEREASGRSHTVKASLFKGKERRRPRTAEELYGSLPSLEATTAGGWAPRVRTPALQRELRHISRGNISAEAREQAARGPQQDGGEVERAASWNWHAQSMISIGSLS